ncbi:hypothetical protein [Novosphingobium sp. JCM 18896]|uniref:hypothetical protein n=1 Tax=Novosphingobium sp. JCM 18896 TaxID=2989731 RepID=UPI0022229B66|nr:hypothetical protein [Novosphingobium sp. JCM 18896]MCW1427654.1 hypothetical protein [Novosphingobium sp. JCM 18896]
MESSPPMMRHERESGEGPTVLRMALARVSSREGLFLALFLALLSAMPFIIAAHPQLTDYPSHLARYGIMIDGGRDPFLARYYDFHWQLTGNLGVDLLIWPLAKLIGLEPAGRVIGMIIPPLTALGLIAVEWVLRRRIGIATLMALTFIWSPAMVLGFYNFCLSLALLLLSFALWVRLDDWPKRWLVFIPIGLAMWLCHASGWGVLGVLVFGYEFHKRKSLHAVLATWPLAFPLIPMLLSGGAKGALSYGSGVGIFKLAIWIQAMRDQSFTLDIVTLALALLVLLAAGLARKIDGRLGWATLILLILTFAMPRHFGGGDYADYRLIAVSLMIGCLAIDWSAPRWLVWLAPVLFLVRLDLTCAAWEVNSRETTQILKALDYMPRGARVAGVIVVEARNWSLNPFEHVMSYATVRKSALVNSHFAIPGVHMLRLKEGGPGFVDPSHRIAHWPGRKVWLHNFKPAKQADYLWFIGRTMPSSLPEGAKVLFATRHSFLVRLANRAAAR